MRTSTTSKKSVTTSFNINTLECFGCEGHKDLKLWRRKGSAPGEEQQAEVFILADQSWPPVLPTNSGSRCLKIIRREHGSIFDLATEFLHLARGMEVGKGSMVLIGSISHMARAGTVGYVEDLLSAASQIKFSLGGNVQVALLLPLFLGGCNCPMTIRTVAEVAKWASVVFAKEGLFLTNSFNKALSEIIVSPRNDGQDNYMRQLRLPITSEWPATKATWNIDGESLVTKVKPTDAGTEAIIIMAMIDELKSGLDVDIDAIPSFDRVVKKDNSGSLKKKKYLVMGNGQATNMAEALARNGQTVATAVIPEWRVDSGNVGLLCERAEAAIDEFGPEVIILMGLEESFYMAQQETGHTLPARKANDGAFHVDGDLIVAGNKVQLRLLKLMNPIWDMTIGRKLIVINPMIRYVTASCCDDPNHIPNRLLPNYEAKIKSGLDGVKETTKVFLHSGGHNHCRVMDTSIDFTGLPKEAAWGNSPTIPKPAVFDRMVKGLAGVEVRIDPQRKRPVGVGGNLQTRGQEDEGWGGGGGKRGPCGLNRERERKGLRLGLCSEGRARPGWLEGRRPFGWTLWG
jgi:hypothetical protein